MFHVSATTKTIATIIKKRTKRNENNNRTKENIMVNEKRRKLNSYKKL